MQTKEYNFANEILGTDFISPERIMGLRRDIKYTREQMSFFVETLPPKERLDWCRANQHILIAGPNRPMSLVDVVHCLKDVSTRKEILFLEGYPDKDRVVTCWIILRKNPVVDSGLKSWDEQCTMLSEDEVIPNIAEMAWCMTTHRLVNNGFLFQDFDVRTSSIFANGNHITIGKFNRRSMSIHPGADGVRREDVRISTIKKQRPFEN